MLQETVDSSFEKHGFRKDGVRQSPMVNITFANMDWDARVYPPFFLMQNIIDLSYIYCELLFTGHYFPQTQSAKSLTTHTNSLQTPAQNVPN